MHRFAIALAALLLGACATGGGGGGIGGIAGNPAVIPASSVAQPQPADTRWHIGPWDAMVNYSSNLPLYMTDDASGNPYFDFGFPGSSPHYITRALMPGESLLHATAIHMKFKIDGPADAVITGNNCTQPSTVTLYFSWPTEEENGWVKGDTVNWSDTSYRWWAEFARSGPLKVGETYDLVAPLDPSANWNTVFAPVGQTSRLSSVLTTWYNRDRGNAGRVGFTFSDCGGAGHGAQASEVVRFTILYFAVE